MSRLRLGLLQVNRDMSPIGDAFPDDSHRFRDLFDRLEQRFDYRVYMTIGGEVPGDPSECDAFLITGSPLSVLDDLPFLAALYDFIRACDAARVPLLGVCFGHQAIACALGGQVARVDWNVGIHDLEFDPLPFMQGPATLPLYTFHHDAVTVLPEGARVIGRTAGCDFASYIKGDHILTCQAHPEFTDRFMRAVLDETRPHLDANTAAAAEASLSRTARGDVFARWAAAFLGGGA